MPNGIASPGNTQSLPVVAQVFASHDAAVMCFSPGPRDCVVYAIRLASSRSGRLFFPFWMSRSSSRRRRRRSVIAFDSEDLWDCSQLPRFDGNGLCSYVRLSLVSLRLISRSRVWVCVFIRACVSLCLRMSACGCGNQSVHA